MYDGIPQIVHPDRVVDEAGLAKLSGIDPVYPLTEGLALGSLRRAIAQALQKLPDLPEWISPEVLRRCSFPPIREALNRVHVPVELTDILPEGPFWSRLAFDELLAGQLALALVRAQLRRPAGDRHAGDGHLRNRIIDALPYALTTSQRTRPPRSPTICASRCGCCGCCRAMSARARRWWRCSPRPRWPRPASRPR